MEKWKKFIEDYRELLFDASIQINKNVLTSQDILQKLINQGNQACNLLERIANKSSALLQLLEDMEGQ